MKRVELEPIRQAVADYLAKDHSWKELCEAMEWMEAPNKPESARLQRALGLRPQTNGKVNKRVNESTAIQIIRAIGRAPMDFGI